MASGFLHDGASDQRRDMAKRPKKNRVQFDYAPRAVERLNALRLYEALIEETESGRQFLIKDETGAVAPFRLFL
jgi:hypothetical protein